MPNWMGRRNPARHQRNCSSDQFSTIFLSSAPSRALIDCAHVNRIGLLIALGIALVAGIILGVFPQIDLAVSSYFYDPDSRGFFLGSSINWLRELAVGLVAIIALPAVITLPLKLLTRGRVVVMPARAALFLMITLAIGPGVITNIILKENWHR